MNNLEWMFGNRYAQNQWIAVSTLAGVKRYQESQSTLGYLQQIQEDIWRACL